MKRAGYLFDEIVTFKNLMLAAKKAMRGKRHKRTAAAFFFRLENEIFRLKKEMIDGSYQPSTYNQFEIREPKVRKICSSVFRDRVVHHAIFNVLENHFEQRLFADSYACRPNKGSHAAMHRVQQFSRKYKFYLKCDIRKYFESIDHGVLKGLLSKMFKDKKLLCLLSQLIDHIPPNDEAANSAESMSKKGIPIGNLSSQYFANIYLGELDHYVKESLRVKGYVRYMDDFICFGENAEILQNVLESIRSYLGDALRLQLKEKVVRIAPVTEGVPFLGFRVFPNLIRLQRVNLVRFRRKFRKKQIRYGRGLITGAELAQSVQSMIAHIQHANSTKLRRSMFKIES